MRKANLIQTAIWRDKDFLALGLNAKAVYLLLLTQPTVNCAGQLPITVRRWSSMLGMSAKELNRSLSELADAAYVWIDGDTEELVIRSWIKYNIRGSKLEAAARDQLHGIASRLLRTALQAEYGDIFGGEERPSVAQRRPTVKPALRFKVLQRDQYTCRYCGAKAPDVELEVDHVQAAATAGTNELDNLITACFACNNGKGSVPLTSIPNTPSEKPEYPIPETDASTVVEGKGTEVVLGSSFTQRSSSRARDRIWLVYAEYHPQAKLLPDRAKRLDKWLEHYDEAFLIDAVHGNHLDPHCNGQNDRGTEYHEFELIFRDAGHIERYASVARNGTKPTSRAARTLQLAQQLREAGQ